MYIKCLNHSEFLKGTSSHLVVSWKPESEASTLACLWVSHVFLLPFCSPTCKVKGMDRWWFYSPGLWTSSVRSLGIIAKCTIPRPSCISVELEIECLEIFSSNNPPGDSRWCSQVLSSCLPRFPWFWCLEFSAFHLFLSVLIFSYSVFPRELSSLDCEPLRTGAAPSTMPGTREVLSKQGKARKEQIGFPGSTTTYAHPSNFHKFSYRLSHKSSDLRNGKNTDFGTWKTGFESHFYLLLCSDLFQVT